MLMTGSTRTRTRRGEAWIAEVIAADRALVGAIRHVRAGKRIAQAAQAQMVEPRVELRAVDPQVAEDLSGSNAPFVSTPHLRSLACLEASPTEVHTTNSAPWQLYQCPCWVNCETGQWFWVHPEGDRGEHNDHGHHNWQRWRDPVSDDWYWWNATISDGFWESSGAPQHYADWDLIPNVEDAQHRDVFEWQ